MYVLIILDQVNNGRSNGSSRFKLLNSSCPAEEDQDEGETEGTTELSLEGVANVGSEMKRLHITEKNKAMAAKLKVLLYIDHHIITGADLINNGSGSRGGAKRIMIPLLIFDVAKIKIYVQTVVKEVLLDSYIMKDIRGRMGIRISISLKTSYVYLSGSCS